MSYTIDCTERDGSWWWRLYTRGGSEVLVAGKADTIEGAGSEATRQMLVHHRTGEVDR